MGNCSNDIAIIGMSGVFPDAVDLGQFFNNLLEGKDSVREPSRDRLVYCSIDPDKDYKIAGHLGRIDQFDHLYFGISRKEAEFIEPSQRIALQLACTAIQNAGYDLDDFRGSNTGIYISSGNLYPMVYLQNINAVYGQKDPTIHTGTLSSMMFGRIAYELQLKGPGVMIDTGCSSSLIAVNEAVEKLIHNKIDYALVGAVNLKALFFEKGKGTGHLQAASLTGKTRAFDAGADGIGIGEGGGLLLLKRADRALADKDNIHALIRGVGVSQDGGRSNSITAPSPAAQTEAIVQAWENAGIHPETIGYLETHGAGTQLGDMIEFQSLTDAINQYTDKKGFCAIGSVKSNIGHLGNAAGIAGLIKGILALKHRVKFPIIHFEKPNPYIDFDNSGAFVNTAAAEWPASGEHPRRCAVSSFGLSGTNAHVVLEEVGGAELTLSEGLRVDEEGHILKISAKSLTALDQYIQDIAVFVQGSPMPIGNILYTLNKGRSDLRYRISVEANCGEELLRKLAELARSRRNARGTWDLKPVRQKDAKVVLLLSVQEYAEGLLEELERGHIVIHAVAGRIRKAATGDVLNRQQEALAIQYGLYLQCLAYGIAVRTVMGTGIGSVTNKVITGALGLEEAVQSLEGGAGPVAPLQVDKFVVKVRELHEAEAPVFVEVGSGGIFSVHLTALKESVPDLKTEIFLARADDRPLGTLSRLYNAGIPIDWGQYYGMRNYKRVEAPVYPFDKIRCWYDKPYRGIEPGIAQWCYEPGWVKASGSGVERPVRGGTLLVFCDEENIHTSLGSVLGEGNTCIPVRAAAEFSVEAAGPAVSGAHGGGGVASGYYTCAFHEREQLERLRDHLLDRGILIDGIVYLRASGAPRALRAGTWSEEFKEAYLPLHLILQVFHAQLKQPDFRLVTLTANAQAVTGRERMVAPVRGMLTGLMKAVMLEYPAIKLTCLDVAYGEGDAAEVAGLLAKEMAGAGLIRYSAIREGERYVPSLRRAVFDGEAIQEAFSLKEGGVYIVSGGASGIGLEACGMLAGEGRCTIILIGRTDLDAGSDDGEERIRAIARLEAAGAWVEYHCGDVNDVVRMGEIIKAVAERYGRIDGVIHAAGVGSAGVAIVDRRVEDLVATINPKAGGTVILDELTRDLNQGFFLMCSSAGSIVPSKNCADYTAANAFEDAYAHHMRAQGRKYVAVNWADWKETGLQYRKNLLRSQEEIEAREKYVQGIGNQEGLAAMKCAIMLGRPQLAVVKADLTGFRINPYFVLEEAMVQPVQVVEDEVKNGAEDMAGGGDCMVQAALEDFPEKGIVSGGSDMPTQERVARLWYEVLKLERIDPDDDFYEIGGHSLNIMQLLNLLKKEFGIEIGLEEFLYNSTIRKLAERIGELLFREGVAKYEPIVPIPESGHYPLSHAQKRFWMLNQLEGREAYNVPMAFIIEGDLEPALLEKAFGALIGRHESLRTSFILVDGQPRQRVHAAGAVSFKMDYTDLSAEGHSEEYLRKYVEEEAGRPFDLAQTPLIRAMLLKTGEQRHILCMTMHHIVVDARSIIIVKTELMQLYHGAKSGQEVELPLLPIQYKDFVAWQERQLSGDRFDNHQQYWSNRLQGLDGRGLKPDFQRVGRQGTAAGKVLFPMGAVLTEQMRKLSERNSTTLFATTMAVFKLLLSKVTDLRDIVVATPVSGRDHGDLENQVGIYLNTLLLRTMIDEGESFAALLRRVKVDTGKDFEHQVYPYDLLAAGLQEGREDRPLFHIGFTWSVKGELPGDTAGESFAGLSIREYGTGFVKAKADLWMLVSETADDIHCSLVFKTGLYRKQSIEILRDRFLVLARQVVTSYDKPVRDLHIKLPEELSLEKQQLDVNFSF